MPNQFMEGLQNIGTKLGTHKLYIYDGENDRFILVSELLAGTIYGSVYGMEIGWIQVNAVQDTWYLVSDASMADGQLSGVTHDGDGQMTVSKAADYHCTYEAALEADAANIHALVAFAVNGTPVNDGMGHIETFGANREQSIGGVAILTLAVGDTIEVAVRHTDAATPDLLIDHLNIAIHELR